MSVTPQTRGRDGVAAERHRRQRYTWLPMALGLAVALAVGLWLPAWAWMWALSVAIFAGFKWATLALALDGGVSPAASWRLPAYLFLWPGMDARSFLAGAPPSRLERWAWVWAGVKTLFGAATLWLVARRLGGGPVSGWAGMVGLIFLLHFGSFELLALFWRRQGVDAQPLMRAPVLAASLGEFWGKRWNSGFRDLVFGLWFVRLRTGYGARRATLTLFLFSGLVHDLVISLPARGGYGLPTAYFLLQGGGLLAEHVRGTPLARRRGRWPGRVWTLLVVVGPAFWLFHPPFVRRVILPFLQAIHAL